jgi:hypothetical protein
MTSIAFKVLEPHPLSRHRYALKIRTKAETTIEMKRLLLNIERKLPNVVAAGPDLAALRFLLNVQLDEAAALDKQRRAIPLSAPHDRA